MGHESRFVRAACMMQSSHRSDSLSCPYQTSTMTPSTPAMLSLSSQWSLSSRSGISSCVCLLTLPKGSITYTGTRVFRP